MAKKRIEIIRRCRNDFVFFAENFLYITTKEGELVRFKLRPHQRELFEGIDEHERTIVLKARQIGSSTLVAAYFFWRTQFNRVQKSLVMAQTREAAETLMNIYKTFHEHLPSWMQRETIADSKEELRYSRDCFIKILSAGSKSGPSGHYTQVHASEAGLWANLQRAAGDIFPAAKRIVLESTARGYGPWRDLWYREDEFHRMFFSWKDDPTASRKKKPGNIHPKLEELKAIHKLSKGQLYWAQYQLETACLSDWDRFLQENPITPEQAFVAKGSFFFPKELIDPTVPDPADGVRKIRPYDKFRVYSMGVDPNAGGLEGDYAAICILDVTDKDKPLEALTYYGKPDPIQLQNLVLELAREYNATAVIEEQKGFGIIDYLRTHRYHHMYTRDQKTKIDNQTNLVRRFGWWATERTRSHVLAQLKRYIVEGKLNPTDLRFLYEVPNFVYDAAKNRFQHKPGKNDDMIIAYALAIEGAGQTYFIREESKNTRPVGAEELIKYELTHGMSWDKHQRKKNTDLRLIEGPYWQG